MKLRPLIALVWLITLCALPAYGQDSSAVICGKPLNHPGTLSWENYKAKAKSPTEKVDVQAIEDTVIDHLKAWPAEVQGPVRSALEAFKAGNTTSLPVRAIRLSKNADLPAMQFGFFGTEHAVELPVEADSPPCSDVAQASARIEAGYVVLLMERAHAAVIASGMVLTSAQISALEKDFDKYLFDGFPMYPWEALANSVFLTKNTIANGPPSYTVVLFHPAVGVVGSIESAARSDTATTLSVEALGFVRYSSDFSSWYGASLLAVFPSDRNAGYGVAFNYNNYKLGVTWHDDPESGHDGVAVFLGMDLLQFVKERFRVYDGYKKKLDETLRSVVGPKEKP